MKPTAFLAGLVCLAPSLALEYGFDISNYQTNVDFAGAQRNGASFVYIKASEGVSYTNPQFASQNNAASNLRLQRGAYHFARPNLSSGADQARYFISNGGGWAGGSEINLPGALDLEGYPNAADPCYGMAGATMVSWIQDFSNTYHSATGAHPVLYTTTSWWTQCTGNSPAFGRTNPLWIARYNTSPGTLPNGWAGWTFWQNADHGQFPGDQDQYNVDYAGNIEAYCYYGS